MGDDASSNIAGASAFSDKEGDQTIRFIDSDYNTLFTLPNGANIILTTFRGRSRVLPCQYIDDTHTLIGTSVFHIHQFAMVQEQLGAAYRPEHPKRTDIPFKEWDNLYFPPEEIVAPHKKAQTKQRKKYQER